MHIRKSIFDSHSEKKILSQIASRWESKLKLFPQLPLSKIVAIDPSEVSKKEFDYYRKSNVDFTFCNLQGQPEISIEFDGIGGGFSRNGKYIPLRKTADPYRKLKFDFKLRITSQLNYPLIIISFDELERFILDDPLIVVDSIIGQYLANNRFNQIVEERKEHFKSITVSAHPAEVQGLLDWEFVSAEVEAKLEHNIIYSEGERYHYLLWEKLGKKLSFSEMDLFDNSIPPAPPNGFPQNEKELQQLQNRITAINNAQKMGYRVIVRTPQGDITTDIWIRAVDCPHVNPISTIWDITRYVAFKRAYTILELNYPKN
jgi:hypothetical protein